MEIGTASLAAELRAKRDRFLRDKSSLPPGGVGRATVRLLPDVRLPYRSDDVLDPFRALVVRARVARILRERAQKGADESDGR